MMATPVRNERGKSSSLRLLQESIRRPTGSHEVSLSLNTPPLKLAHPSVEGEEEASNTTPKVVGLSALHLEHVVSSVESKFPELVFALGVTTNDHKPVLFVTQRDVSTTHRLATLHECTSLFSKIAHIRYITKCRGWSVAL